MYHSFVLYLLFLFSRMVESNSLQPILLSIYYILLSLFLCSKLPYDVTTEQALTHPEVVSRLESSIQSLRAVTDKVLASIFSSLNLMP